MAKTKKAASRPARKKGAPSERERLLKQLTQALGVPAADVELRALRALAQSLPQPEPTPAMDRAARALQRLFLEIDGFGLPVEVIDLPATVGSGRKCTVWINAPRIETRHLQITREGDAYLIEDLATEHGTFLQDRRIERRVVQHGDEFRLAGYLRVRAEVR